jgi:hypothetical protein
VRGVRSRLHGDEEPHAGQDVLAGMSERTREDQRAQEVERVNPWAVEPEVPRVAHAVPNRVARLRALGNGVVPQCAELVGRRLMDMAA